MTTIWPHFAQRSTHNKKENPLKADRGRAPPGGTPYVDNSVEQEWPTTRNPFGWYALKKTQPAASLIQDVEISPDYTRRRDQPAPWAPVSRIFTAGAVLVHDFAGAPPE